MNHPLSTWLLLSTSAACFVLACGPSSGMPPNAPLAETTPPTPQGGANPPSPSPSPSPSPGAATAQGLNLSDLEAKCDAGEAAACRSVAGAYSNQDMHSALPFYRRACDLGDTESCTDWADLFERLERDDASPEELKQVLAVRQRACDAGDVWGCRAVALHYIEPDPSKRVVEPDEKRAFSLLMKGCLDAGRAAVRGALTAVGWGLTRGRCGTGWASFRRDGGRAS